MRQYQSGVPFCKLMYNIGKVEDEKDNSQAKEYQSFYKQKNVRTVAVHCVSIFVWNLSK